MLVTWIIQTMLPIYGRICVIVSLLETGVTFFNFAALLQIGLALIQCY
ncbi:hypothetical protein V2J09_000916 [Rumex salicifolius]